MRVLLIKCAFSLLIGLSVASCAEILRVQQDVNRVAPFGRYQTFRVLVQHPLEFDHASARAMAERGLSPSALAEVATATLIDQGLTPAPDGERASVNVAFSFGARDALTLYADYVRLDAPNWLWGVDPLTSRYQGDTLALDVFDGATGDAIWHGYASLSLHKFATDEYESRALEAMRRLARSFPPKPELYRSQQHGIVLIY